MEIPSLVGDAVKESRSSKIIFVFGNPLLQCFAKKVVTLQELSLVIKKTKRKVVWFYIGELSGFNFRNQPVLSLITVCNSR